MYRASQVAHDVASAVSRIAPYVRETPIEESPTLSRAIGGRALLKLESTQVSGSFKARGAFNKLLSLTEAERAAGIVTASTGNHGLATAHALRTLDLRGEIFLPASASPMKIEALRARGAQLRLVEADPGAVEVIARAHAAETDRVYVSPYNDPEVVGGQGTIADELSRSLADFDTVIVPVGGGGLIAGIAGFLKATRPSVRVIGCQPRASAVMMHSVEAGRLLELPSDESLSDATVGLVEQGSITFPICQSCVDDWILLDEAELRDAIRLMVAEHSILIEGAAALAVAALWRAQAEYKGKTVVAVLSGSHIGVPDLTRILAAPTGKSTA